MDYIISCDAFVRLAGVTQNPMPDANEWFKTIRIDNGVAVASNRAIMAVENIGGPSGVIHIIADPALINQCRIETPFSSNLTITVNDVLKFAVAKTSMGYIQPGNACLFDGPENQLGQWREKIVDKLRTGCDKSTGPMFWNADDIARLAAASPSGKLVFEEFINAYSRPTLIRDINDYNWFGVFNPFSTLDGHYSAATLPTWI